MRLDNIINNPGSRLKQILETLKKEFGIEIDFKDSKSLSDLQNTASETAKIVKANESFNMQHQNPKVVCSYLILEAIKSHKDTHKEPAMTEKKSKKVKNIVKEGNEIDKAEVLIAGKDIVDDLQEMMEDVSKMQVQKLPAIIDRIKIEFGIGEAANYREQASAALQGVMDSLAAAKESVDNLTMGLSGDVDMAQEPSEPTMQEPEIPAPGTSEEPTEEPGMELPAEEPASGNPEGRARKESRQVKGKALREDLELAAKTVKKLVKHDKMDFNRAMDKVKKSIVGKDEDVAAVSSRAKNLLGEGEEAAQNMGEKIPPELKAWHVQVKSPVTNKLFGNFKIWSPTPDIAKHRAQNAVMEKHGMTEWNDEYEFTIKEIKENASCGATAAGGIAQVPQPLFKKPIKRVGESKAKLGTGTRFKNVQKSAEKSGAKNPAAVAAAAGIKKYGVKKMEKMAHHESVNDVAEASNSAQTLTAQAKPQNSMFGTPAEQTQQQTYNKPPQQMAVPPKQPHAPTALVQGTVAMSGGKKVTVDSDNGIMVGIKDSDNGPVRMVPKSSVTAVDPIQGTQEPKIGDAKVESVTESKKMNPKLRAQRINRRGLKKYDHNDFIDLVHANLGREHAEVAEDCLHGCDYNDHHPDHLHKVADFAKKKGEHNLSYDIKTHFLPMVANTPAPHATAHGVIHPDQASVVTSPPTDLTNFESANKPYKLVVETANGRKGKKTFTNEAEAKKWLSVNGHHLKNVKVDV